MVENTQYPAPDHLSDASRLWWTEVVADYELEPHHLRLLTLAAESFDRATEAREMIDRDGMVIPTATGGLKSHPAVAIERDCRLAFARLVRELDLDSVPAPAATRPPSLPRYRT